MYFQAHERRRQSQGRVKVIERVFKVTLNIRTLFTNLHSTIYIIRTNHYTKQLQYIWFYIIPIMFRYGSTPSSGELT
jgi:hypothetical protein